MCLGCQCPQQIPPPNEKLKKCRIMLQILAAGLLVIGIIGLTCGQVFQFFYNLLLLYFLFIGWRTFNWCMTLMFFLFCTIQTCQALIVFIGMLQYNQLFTKTYVTISVLYLLQLIYYPLAVYFSHFCYRHFKQQFSGNGRMFPLNQPAANNAPHNVNANQGNYQRINEEREGQPPVFPRANEQRQENADPGQFFGGQGVRIG